MSSKLRGHEPKRNQPGHSHPTRSRPRRDRVRPDRPGPGPGRRRMPSASQAADVYQRRELLGGKGANQAVGLAQLGMRPALAGVVGEDQVGQRLLTQARQDRVDVSAVFAGPASAPRSSWTSSTPAASGGTSRTYRPGCCSPGRRRACRHLFLPGRWVSVQLQQPPAPRSPPRSGRTGPDARWCWTARRTRSAGTRCWTRRTWSAPMPGRPSCWSAPPVTTAAEAEKVAAELLRQGPSLVALAVDGIGNLIAWPEAASSCR